MLPQPRGVKITALIRSTISPRPLATKDRSFGLVRPHQDGISDPFRGWVFAKPHKPRITNVLAVFEIAQPFFHGIPMGIKHLFPLTANVGNKVFRDCNKLLMVFAYTSCLTLTYQELFQMQ